MKRRDFLSATAILSLLGAAPALAQTKKAQEKAKKPKPKPKTNKKPAAAASETDSTGAERSISSRSWCSPILAAPW